MSHWKIVKLGDVCSICSSKRIFAREYTKQGIPFYRGKEIIEKHSKNKVSNTLYISEKRYLEIKSKYDVPKIGDILLTSVGTLGVAWFIDESNFYFKDGNLTWLRANDLIDSKFLYWWLNSKEAQEQIERKCIGTTQKALTIETLNKFTIFLPPLDTQKKIAAVLSALDDKIELNNAINKNLEEQAQAIYKNMFPAVTSGEVLVGEYIVPKRGKNLLVKDTIRGDVPVVAGGLEPATYHNESNTSAPVLTISASGANAGYIKLWNIPVWSSDSSFIDSTMTADVYFWYVMLKLRQQEIFDSQTGTAQPHIYPQHIAQLPIKKLDEHSVTAFTERVTPLFSMIGENIQQTKKLGELRDALLPRLMSGEIDVSTVEV